MDRIVWTVSLLYFTNRFTVLSTSSSTSDAQPSWSEPLRPYIKRESALPSFWKKLIAMPRFLRGIFT